MKRFMSLSLVILSLLLLFAGNAFAVVDVIEEAKEFAVSQHDPGSVNHSTAFQCVVCHSAATEQLNYTTSKNLYLFAESVTLFRDWSKVNFDALASGKPAKLQIE